MTRSAAARDIAWLRANPGLGIELFDLLNHRPTPHPGGPTRHHVWDPRRPGWRLIVTDPTPETPPQGGVGHP